MDILKEIGGVAFVFNLSKPGIVHSEVRVTALFTLGALAEANGKQTCDVVAQSHTAHLSHFIYFTYNESVFFHCGSVLQGLFVQKGNVRSAVCTFDQRHCAADTEESLHLFAVCVGRQQQ